jgi:hypothetical protein
VVQNQLSRGMTLQEIVKSSLRGANAYSRSSTDTGVQRDHIDKRMSKTMWQDIGKELVNCLDVILKSSEHWQDRDPRRDFLSTEWINLEQHGLTLFVPPLAVIVEELTSKNQMHAARAELQIVADNTADLLRLYVSLVEKIETDKAQLAEWLAANRDLPFYNYRGLAWDDPERNDGWPNLIYHSYQSLTTGIGPDETTRDAILPAVQELIPKF